MEKWFLTRKYAGIFSTGPVEEQKVFSQGKIFNFFQKVFHRKFIHIPQALWINSDLYRQELILAVISRM